MLKQILAVFLAVALLITLAACGDAPNNESLPSAVQSPVSVEGEIDSQTNSVEDIAEPSAEPTAEAPAEPIEASHIPPATEPEVPQTTAPQPETPAETPAASMVVNPSESKDTVAEVLPADFQVSFSSAEDLIEFTKKNDPKNIAAKAFLSVASPKQELLVPRSVREGLVDYGAAVWKDSATCDFDFWIPATKDDMNTRELFTISITHISSEEAYQQTASEYAQVYYNSKSGTYKGLSYQYADGVTGTENTQKVYSSAWFTRGDYLVKISAYWSNAHKPWSNDYFDYFDFETVKF